MKIHNPIGSKERFLEMFQGVNKIQMNEVAINAMQTGAQLLEKAFDELKNKVAKIKQTNTQTVGEDNFVEIITNDSEGNEITFTFKINSTEADQDDVYNINNAVLTSFKIASENFNVDWDDNMEFVQKFNANRGSEIMNVVSEFASFETDTMSVDDEVYEEAVKRIDKVPYKKSTETMQTSKAYGDEKPTNPDLRVQSDELNKFVSEMEDYVNNADGAEEEDILALPPDYSATDLPTDDDNGSKGIDPYDQAVADAGKNDWKISKRPEKPKNIPPYMKKDTTAGRERAIPSWAETFMENKGVVTDMDTDNIINRGFENTLSPEVKAEMIRTANEILEAKLGVKRFEVSQEYYIKLVKDLAIQIYRRGVTGMNEESEKNDYPDPIGKKFKPKPQFPKKKKKQQSIVKLSEDEMDGKYGGNPEDEIEIHGLPDVPSGLDAKKYANKDIAKSFIEKGKSGDYKHSSGYIDNSIDPNPTPQDIRFEEEVTAETDGININMEDKIEGGLADDKSTSDFCPKQLAMGFEVEMKEHTDDPKIALEIAMDHLVEDPKYYGNGEENPDEMAKIHAQADVEPKQYNDGIGNGEENPDEMAKIHAQDDTGEETGEIETVENQDDLETDELLGYKPHNVNDYSNEEFDYAGAEKEYSDKEGFDVNVDNKDKDIPENFWTEFQALVDEFGEHVVNYLFNNGLRGYYETVSKGNYSFDEVKRSLGMLKLPEVNEKHPLADVLDSDGTEVDLSKQNTGNKGVNRAISEEEGFEEYQGDIGDRYQDGEGNQFSVRNKVKGGVSLQGQGGEKEIATSDIQFLKKLGEGVVKKEIITEQQIKVARQVLKNRGMSGDMTKKEAVQILITHNIK